MPRPCSYGPHKSASTPVAAYTTLPGRDAWTGDRYRTVYCQRHGRQFIGMLYKAASDAAAENDEPEFCIGCGEPTHSLPLVVAVYEGEWYARFDALMCEGCGLEAPRSLGDAFRDAEKLPPRDNRTYGSSRRKQAVK